VETVPLSGKGRLYSFSTIPRNGGIVWVGYVDTPENVRVFVELDGFTSGRRPACDMELVLRGPSTEDTGPRYCFGQQLGEVQG
jgi:hypothetical protein